MPPLPQSAPRSIAAPAGKGQFHGVLRLPLVADLSTVEKPKHLSQGNLGLDNVMTPRPEHLRSSPAAG